MGFFKKGDLNWMKAHHLQPLEPEDYSEVWGGTVAGIKGILLALMSQELRKNKKRIKGYYKNCPASKKSGFVC